MLPGLSVVAPGWVIAAEKSGGNAGEMACKVLVLQ